MIGVTFEPVAGVLLLLPLPLLERPFDGAGTEGGTKGGLNNGPK